MNDRKTLLDWRVTRSGAGPDDRALRLRGTVAGSGKRIYTAPLTGTALDGDGIAFEVAGHMSYACPLSETCFEHRLAELTAVDAAFTEEHADSAIARAAELRCERDRQTARRLRKLLPDTTAEGVVIEFDPLQTARSCLESALREFNTFAYQQGLPSTHPLVAVTNGNIVSAMENVQAFIDKRSGEGGGDAPEV